LTPAGRPKPDRPVDVFYSLFRHDDPDCLDRLLLRQGRDELRPSHCLALLTPSVITAPADSTTIAIPVSVMKNTNVKTARTAVPAIFQRHQGPSNVCIARHTVCRWLSEGPDEDEDDDAGASTTSHSVFSVISNSCARELINTINTKRILVHEEANKKGNCFVKRISGAFSPKKAALNSLIMV
jgi:hypothetical protein